MAEGRGLVLQLYEPRSGGRFFAAPRLIRRLAPDHGHQPWQRSNAAPRLYRRVTSARNVEVFLEELVAGELAERDDYFFCLDCQLRMSVMGVAEAMAIGGNDVLMPLIAARGPKPDVWRTRPW